MRILVVEDSRPVMVYILAILQQDTAFEVVGHTGDGLEAVNMAIHLGPDVILMDLHLHSLDGIEAIGRIMARCPVPIVVLSGELARSEMDLTFEAFRAGAVEVLAKPKGLGSGEMEGFRAKLLRTLQVMSKARVVRRFDYASRKVWTDMVASGAPMMQKTPDVLILGASTGGPQILHAMLLTFPVPFPVPICIAQHIARGFGVRLTEWLSTTGHTVRTAVSHATISPGCVYVGPDDGHMEFLDRHTLRVVSDPMASVAPSVDRLMLSAATIFGASACAVLLTGMGKDGAEGMRALRTAGATTLAQDEESSVVFGMPAAAIALGAAQYVLNPENMAQQICRVLRVVPR